MSLFSIKSNNRELGTAFDIHVKNAINELAYASFALPNKKGVYGDLALGDSLKVFLGKPLKNYFIGEIETLENLMEDEGDFLFLEGFGLGNVLFDEVLTEDYENTNGKEIIRDAIALTGLDDSQVDPDDEIETSFTREYDRVSAFEVIQEISEESATSAGVVGFYFYVDLAGLVHVYPYDKFVSEKKLVRGENMGFLRRKLVRATVVNKIWQLGASKKKKPILGDEWSDDLDINNDATNDWKSGTGTGSVSLDGTFKVAGLYSIKHSTTTPDYYGQLWLELPSGSEYEVALNGYPSVNFQLSIEASFSGLCSVTLRDEDGGEATRFFNQIANPVNFILQSFKGGKRNEEAWQKNIANPIDWDTRIKDFFLNCYFEGTGTGVFWLDNFYFNNRRFEALVQDVQSQTQYKMKSWKAPIEEKLESDAECEIVAREWLKRKKDPSRHLEVGVRNRIFEVTQGHLLPIKDAQVHKIDMTARVLEVEHFLTEEEGLGTKVDVSLEPLGFSPLLLVTSHRLKELDEGFKRKVF